jgi:hypothetical protein
MKSPVLDIASAGRKAVGMRPPLMFGILPNALKVIAPE